MFSTITAVIALACFIAASLGVATRVGLTDAGLAFLTISFLLYARGM